MMEEILDISKTDLVSLLRAAGLKVQLTLSIHAVPILPLEAAKNPEFVLPVDLLPAEFF